jgi:hypothetical protein
MEPWAAAKKKLSVRVAVPPAPVRFPGQRPLAPSVASVMSVTSDKDDNEMILGAVKEIIIAQFYLYVTKYPLEGVFRL